LLEDPLSIVLIRNLGMGKINYTTYMTVQLVLMGKFTPEI